MLSAVLMLAKLKRRVSVGALVLNPSVGQEGARAPRHGKKEKKARRSGKSAALNICSPFWPS